MAASKGKGDKKAPSKPASAKSTTKGDAKPKKGGKK